MFLPHLLDLKNLLESVFRPYLGNCVKTYEIENRNYSFLVEHRIERNPTLDVCRALCVLLVLSTNVLGSFQMASIEEISNNFRHIWYFGSFGVTGFFVLSAFLLTSILSKEKEIGKYNVRNFYVRRILRI